MAITTQDGLVAALAGAQKIVVQKASVTAVAGRTLSLWSATGVPGTGEVTNGQAAAGAVATSSLTGAVGFTNGGGLTNYLLNVSGQSAATGSLIIFDRLWDWTSGGSGWSATTTGAQNTTSPAALTRPDANGNYTELWVETLAAGGAASGTSTITYTDPGGTGSRSATLLASKISSPPIGTIEQYALQAGAVSGVKSIQTLNNSATWTSGTFRISIVRRLAQIPVTANLGFTVDAFTLGMPIVYDNACLGLAFFANSTTTGPLTAVMAIGAG